MIRPTKCIGCGSKHIAATIVSKHIHMECKSCGYAEDYKTRSLTDAITQWNERVESWE